MSVVVANDYGWLLDACSLIDEGFKCCLGANEERFVSHFKKQFFDILKPHIVVTSTSDASSKTLQNTETCASENASVDPKSTRKKRKRRRSDLNHGELDAADYHKKVRLLVLEGSRSLLDAGNRCGYFKETSHPVATSQMPVPECRLAALCNMAKQFLTDEDSTPTQVVKGRADLDARLNLFSRITENPDSHAREVTLMGERYFLPPRSHFLMSDIMRLQPLVNSGEKFDLIVLDPPWENKSVKRSSRYSFLPSSQLKQLPVSQLSAAGCVVVTWVTNRPRHLRFVREELYPHWGVKDVVQWLWVKVTRTGEFVFPLDSPHKKPYEALLLGRVCAGTDNTRCESELPDQRLIVGIPSVLHSHKPSLSAVLKPYIRSDAKCLEMFARGLQPDWTSWGNEVIKFQHHSYYITEEAECACDTRTEATDTKQRVDTTANL
ncbi:N(6)-adenine-specific methyltransferase METTL4 [Brachyhypopomus gauderio]|uniref:N(6)-adenine-specific methyltransferase METTL4 n=1 Tax=Brachyhypopomus gauderio TaxID=698409 RepID=UPI0040424658